LNRKGELLSPSFNIENIKIPIGFIPKKIKYETNEKITENKILDRVVNQISEKSNQTHEEIMKSIKKFQDDMKIIPEVAVLILARKNNLNINDFFEDVEALLFKENEE
jgi:hypothetical protein